MDPIEIVRWTASLLTIIAALMVGWGEPARLVAWGFVLFTLASVAWIGAAFVDWKPALLFQNVAMLGANAWGLARWWKRG